MTIPFGDAAWMAMGRLTDHYSISRHTLIDALILAADRTLTEALEGEQLDEYLIPKAMFNEDELAEIARIVADAKAWVAAGMPPRDASGRYLR